MINYFLAPGLPTLSPIPHVIFIKKYCELRKTTLSELAGKSRKAELCIERHIVFYLLNKNYGLNGIIKTRGKHISLDEMGACFNRDHATVINSCRRISDLIYIDKRFASEVKELARKLSINLGMEVKV